MNEAAKARWTPRLLGLNAISVQQPSAWLIVHGGKNVENRSKRLNFRGDVLVQAGKSRQTVGDEAEMRRLAKKYGVSWPSEFEFGGIIGVVEITDCVTEHPSKWRTDSEFGWVLNNPRSLAFRPCKGQLNLFKPQFDGV